MSSGDRDNFDDLFEQMNSKKKDSKKATKAETDSDDDKEKSSRRELKKFGMDFYKILGVPKDASQMEIKKRYRHLIMKNHPDKLKDIPSKKYKKLQEEYQLIRVAGEVLVNPEKRKQYDLEQKVLRSADFESQKNSFAEFMKLQESEITEEKKKMAQIDFEKEVMVKNKKIGFDPSAVAEKLTKSEIEKRFNDLEAQRKMQEIETTKANPVEGRQFSNAEFNRLFEKSKRKEEKKRQKKQEAGELVPYDTGFTAFNDEGNFMSISGDYENLFAEEGNFASGIYSKNDEFSGNSESGSEGSFEPDVSYYEGHNKNKITKEEIDRKMKEREEEDEIYKAMKIEDFKGVFDDQFGISKDFGTLIGKNSEFQITFDDEEDKRYAKAYNRMLKYDKKNKH